MQDKATTANMKSHEIELPQTIISEFARFLVPEIKKFYESEDGKKAFAEWQAKQEQEKKK